MADTFVLTCTTCHTRLYRAVVHQCRGLEYDYDDAWRHARLGGVCVPCKRVMQIYFVDDMRVYFPPEPIRSLEKIGDISLDASVILNSELRELKHHAAL